MTSGKIILSVAAAVVTVGSGLAFKVANKFATNKVFVKTANLHCVACTKLWTNLALSNHNTQCRTASGAAVKGTATAGVAHNKYGFWTKTLSGHVCSGKVTLTTITP